MSAARGVGDALPQDDFAAIDPFDRIVYRLHHRDGNSIRKLSTMFGEPPHRIEDRLRSYEAATDFTTALQAIRLPADEGDRPCA